MKDNYRIDDLRREIEEKYNVSIPLGNEEDLLDDLQELVDLKNDSID